MNYSRLPRRKIETDLHKSIFIKRLKKPSNQEPFN